MLSFILWDVAPEILALFTDNPAFGVRWYGLLFASAFLLGQVILGHILKTENKPARELDVISVYMVVAVVAGARLGHCLFYEPGYFLAHPFEILKIWKGGLASHGATAGILFGVWLYARNRSQSYLGTLDRLVITIALGGALIRFGNLMNSEILGKPTDSPSAFMFSRSAHDVAGSYDEYFTLKHISQTGRDTTVNGFTYPLLKLEMPFGKKYSDPAFVTDMARNTFVPALKAYSESADNFKVFGTPKLDLVPADGSLRADLYLYGVPRHPAQLYEALSCLVLLALLYSLWNRWRLATPPGSLFGIFVIWVFTLRFFYEFLKENQVAFENDLPLNMGQWLSIPLIVAGVLVTVMAFTGKTRGRFDPPAQTPA